MIDLNELRNGLPAITPAWGRAMAEASGVCLESQGHRRSVPLRVMGYVSHTQALDWTPIGDQERRSWADLQEATEFGATANAALLAKQELGYAVVERAAKGTGIDYWMGNEVEGPTFQNKARLEVSGILRAEGNSQDVQTAVSVRVRANQRQTQQSRGTLPACVIVVEFGSPLAEVQMT